MKSRRDKRLSIRLNPEEKDAITVLAMKEDRTLAGLIRQAVKNLIRAKQEEPVR